MLKLMSEETTAHLLSFSAGKKIAFLVLLYERMIPELCSFCLTEGRDFSVFQKARKEFWQWLMGDDSSISWGQFREDVLSATPDSEDFGTLAASFALNAALVAADIAGFIEDGHDSRIVEAIGYARDSLDANATNEMGATVFNRAVEDYVKAHPLVQKEARTEEEDVAFLSTMQEPPWPENIVSMVRQRAETQRGLLN
ncbi:YjaG family protein [Bradyrhizobium septentrionale]|uniref:DUF416 family protein n=1 Tax=Bradyrhizobium septentrionale TaxID=1404411 RepID=A0A973VZI1_9BRAD|nr:DUF416 family protein [Bradyrhizobium septentrionale]UGY13540.1 YjaG family protein [Bradyrhizobium septentrionale]UGY22181.1 YjaG family protein [Bradyrhizobium septentrionale]